MTYIFKFKYHDSRLIQEKAIDANSLGEARIEFYKFISFLNSNGKQVSEC